jgi:hypothetical protein
MSSLLSKTLLSSLSKMPFFLLEKPAFLDASGLAFLFAKGFVFLSHRKAKLQIFFADRRERKTCRFPYC